MLDKWSPSSDAVLAKMRKAGLLAELDTLNEAQEVLRATLHQIRRSVHATVGPNLYLLSLEGWLHLLDVQGPDENRSRQYGSRDEAKPDFELRDRYFRPMAGAEDVGVQPLANVGGFRVDAYRGATGTKPHRTGPVPGFDPGSRVTQVHMRGTGLSPWLPAFACIRLYEQVGIPLRFSDSALSNACRWVMQFNSFWSPALLILAGKTGELKEQHLLDRTRIANMKGELAANIHRWAMDALKRERSGLTPSIPPGSHSGELLEALIEVLSGLTIKIGAEELREAMSLALSLHSEPGIYAHWKLQKTCQSWTERLLEAADEGQIVDWLPDMIRSIIPEENISIEPSATMERPRRRRSGSSEGRASVRTNRTTRASRRRLSGS